MGASILELQHSKSYVASIRKPTSHMENLFGYDIIKLEQDFEFTVYRNKFEVKRGQYLGQCRFAPNGPLAPIILNNWKDVQTKFHVFKSPK